MLNKRYFITGTDTHIGKTYVTCQLLSAFQQQGQTAIGIKPIQSGIDETGSDTERLMQYNSIKLPKEIITPYTLTQFTSPHIAAKNEGITLSVDKIVKACQPALNQNVDVILIEGIGGWNVPLNDTETTVDLAKKFNCPIILVVGLRLGCLNHAALTVESIKSHGIPFAGWVANQIQPDYPFEQEYLESLTAVTRVPFLGYVAYQNRPDKIQWHSLGHF